MEQDSTCLGMLGIRTVTWEFWRISRQRKCEGVAQPVSEHRSIRCPHAPNICCAISRLSSAINRLPALRTRTCNVHINVHAATSGRRIHYYTQTLRPSVVAMYLYQQGSSLWDVGQCVDHGFSPLIGPDFMLLTIDSVG